MKQRSPQTARSYNSAARNHLGVERFGVDGWLVDERCSLAARPVTELGVAEVREWHRRIALEVAERKRFSCKDGTRVANLALVLLKQCLLLAEADRVIPVGSSPTAHVKRFAERPRQRYLTDAELAAVWDALAKVERMRVREAAPSQRRFVRGATQALRLCLLLALRKSESLALEWSMVDLAERVLRLPSTKTGYREVPLSDAAIGVLQEQRRAQVDRWVFPSRRKRGTPIVDIYDVWETVLDVSRIDPTDVVIHTARHSLATNSLRRGEPIEHVSLLLGHSSVKVTREVYGRPLATPGARAVVAEQAARIVRVA